MSIDGTSHVDDEPNLASGRIALLQDSGRALQQAVDLDAIVRITFGTVIPSFADLAVLVIDEHARGTSIEVAHARPEAARKAEREIREAWPFILTAARQSAREERYARWVPVLSETASRFLARGNPRLARLIRGLDLRSLILIALRVGGRTIGGLALARAEGRPEFTAADFAAAQVLARRVSLAAETAIVRQDLKQGLDPAPTLAAALEKWIRVFDAAWWGAAIVDVGDHRIEAANAAFARLHGLTDPAGLVGRPFADLLAIDRQGELERWQDDAGGGVYESEHLRRDGSRVPVLVSVTPLYDERRSGSYVVTVQDLSDLKRTEERLQRAQRMEAVGRLAGGVAHEVNNMMTIILGFSDLLGQDGHAAEQQREIEEIRKAAMRAARITAQLLAFSRQQVLQPTDLELNAVVEEMAPVLRLMLPANVRVETSLAPLDALVRADRSQLEQVLINLAFNARDAMVSGGTIRLVTESRRLGAAAGRRLIGIPIPEGSYGLISVIDTGHGMDPGTLSQVFEPFFTTKPVGSGTGLGLSTVYGIVKQSGGYVWADSTPGVGTTFTICLPMVRTGAIDQPEPAVEEPAVTARGETVMVLEDEDGVRELSARVLRDRGFQVVLARNGAEALETLERGSGEPDLLLTDVIVPDMGTEELEREVHRVVPDLPILYMSGYPRDDILARGLLRQDQPFLQKPFTSEDLAQEVGRMIQGS
jgi:PAS domain S-box-containing protein